jgi:hypothetical protein
LSHFTVGSIAKSFKFTDVESTVQLFVEEKIVHLVAGFFDSQICCLSANSL